MKRSLFILLLIASQFARAQNSGYDFAGEWRDDQGNIAIIISKTGNGFTGSIKDDGVWILNDPNAGKKSAGGQMNLENFWTSGNTVHFVKKQYIRDDRKKVWGPVTITYNLAMPDGGNTLKGTVLTSGTYGPPAEPRPLVLYKRD